MMKKILFYSENFCDQKTNGSFKLTTFRIAKNLKENIQYDFFNAFWSKYDGNDKSIYSDVIKLSKSNYKFKKALFEFIKKNDIDVVVNMSRFFRHRLLIEASRNHNKNVKVVLMQHFAPGSEMKKPKLSSGFHLLKLNPFNPLYWLRTSFYPLLKLPRQLKLPKIYSETYRQSDYTHEFFRT